MCGCAGSAKAAPRIARCMIASFPGHLHGDGGRPRAYVFHPTLVSQDGRVTDINAKYLVCWPMKLIDVRVTRDVHVEEGVVQRLPRSSVGVIWHITIVPVLDVLHSLTLIWRMLTPGPVKVGLDKFSQFGPADRRADILR